MLDVEPYKTEHALKASEAQPWLALNWLTLRKLCFVALLMFGFGYAMIPIYKKICEITGVNLITPKNNNAAAQAKVANTQIDTSRLITVEFDANARGPWRFRPTMNSVQVHPGQMTQIMYEVVNQQARPMVAQAIPSYAPQQADQFFKKIDCFCFKQQTLAANQAKQMPVTFYIDPKLPAQIKTITLSYTFFEVEGAKAQAS